MGINFWNIMDKLVWIQPVKERKKEHLEHEISRMIQRLTRCEDDFTAPNLTPLN